MSPSTSAPLIDLGADPFTLFDTWFTAAGATEPNDPNAMYLATTSPEGRPSVRAVLLKGHDHRGFVFYTNLESRKGQHLQHNPFAAVVFHWKSQRRQIRIEGRVSEVTAEEADQYFASRHRESRISAIASEQSRPLPDRETFEQRIRAVETQFKEATPPRPAVWSGFRLTPDRIEFWQDRAFRMHDRAEWTRDSTDATDWRVTRLYP